MRHIHTVTRRPNPAQDTTVGEYLQLVVQLLGVVANALVAKEEIQS